MDPDDRLKLTLVEVLLVVGLLVILILFVKKVSDDTLFKQKSTVIDLALIHDSVLASNGNLELNYKNINQDFNILFNQDICKVIINKKGSDERSASSYICAYDKYLESVYEITNNKIISFIKKDNFEIRGKNG